MEEIDLLELFKLFWRKKIQIFLIVILFLLIGYIYTFKYIKPEYSAVTTLVVATTVDNENTTNSTVIASDITINSKLVSTYTELIKSKNILQEVILDLGINIEEDELRKSIAITNDTNTSIINLKVTNKKADYASKIANKIANTFIKKISEIYNINNIQIVSQADTPTSPSNINHTKDLITFGLIGIIISIIYVIIGNIIDTTIKSAHEIEEIYKLPVLVSIPMYETKKKKGAHRK